MISSPLRAGALAAAAVGLAAALAACASTSGGNAGPISAGGPGSPTQSAAPTTPAASPTTPAPSESTHSSGEPNPGGPIKTSVPTATPVAQVSKAPAKSILVPIDHETVSRDGRTLYLEIEARGGACGQYTVVVQESSTAIHVGLAQLPVKPGIMCPMVIGPRTYSAKLAAPVGSRPVIDLADGSRL